MSWTQYCDWRDIETFLWGDPFRRARNNQDVDNILSKKFKPSSSHILEIYFEKSRFHKHFRTDMLADHLQVNKL